MADPFVCSDSLGNSGHSGTRLPCVHVCMIFWGEEGKVSSRSQGFLSPRKVEIGRLQPGWLWRLQGTESDHGGWCGSWSAGGGALGGGPVTSAPDRRRDPARGFLERACPSADTAARGLPCATLSPDKLAFRLRQWKEVSLGQFLAHPW